MPISRGQVPPYTAIATGLYMMPTRLHTSSTKGKIGPTKGKLGELIYELIDFMEKTWIYNDVDIKRYKNGRTRLGMGRGDHQLGRQPGAFLAGAFFFQK